MNAKELLNAIKSDKWYESMDEAIAFLAEYDSEHGGLDIIDYDIAEELAKRELDNGGLLRLAHFIGQAEILTYQYYRLDGYNNLVNITKDWVEMSLEDIVNEGQ